MNLFLISNYSVSITSLVIILLLVFYGRNMIHRIWAFCNAAVFCWGVGAILFASAQQINLAITGWKMALVGGYFISTFYYHTVYLLSGDKGRGKNKIFLFFSYFFMISSAILTLIRSEYVISNFRFLFHSVYYPTATLGYTVIFSVWAIIALVATYKLFTLIKLAEGTISAQAKYLLPAFVIGYIGGGSVHLPSWGISLYPIGNFGVALYAIISTYALLRRNLLDIRIAGVRLGLFILVYGTVLGIPFFWGYKYGLWQQATWIMLVLASGGPFLYNRLRKRAEAAILKEELRCHALISGLAKDVAYMRHIKDLLDKVTSAFTGGVRLKFAAFWMMEDFYKSYQLKSCSPKEMAANLSELIKEDDPLASHLASGNKVLTKAEIKRINLNFDAELIIPCMVNERLMGILALGAKENNIEYSANDLIVYSAFGTTLSLVIENCIFWHDIETRQRIERVREMDFFSYSMRHEIGNPTVVAKGQAELLKQIYLKMIPEGEARDDFEKMVNFIIEATTRILKMLEAIKNFGAAATGVGKPILLEDVVEHTCCLYEPQFREGKVTFEKALQENKDKLYVLGEIPTLMNVLENLLKNSEHAVRGAADKKVTLKTEYVNGEYARVIISDNGYGIKPEFMPVLFAPFTTTKASTEGTGMGLHDVRRMVRQYNGRVWAESAGEGKGAVFYVELPICKDKPGDVPEKDRKQKKMF